MLEKEAGAAAGGADGDTRLVIDVQETPARAASDCDSLARVSSRHVWLQEQPSNLRRRSKTGALQPPLECAEHSGGLDPTSSSQSLQRQCTACDVPEHAQSPQGQHRLLLPSGSRMLVRSGSSMGPHGIRLHSQVAAAAAAPGGGVPAASTAGSSGGGKGGAGLFGACGAASCWQQQLVEVTVVDYSKQQVQVAGAINNYNLAGFLSQPRPAWSRVRWISVRGQSWDVIETLADEFDLHPLSVEDIVHIPQRIKAEFYSSYLHTSALLLSADGSSAAAAAAAAAAAGDADADAVVTPPASRTVSQASALVPLRRQMSVASASARARAAAAVAKQAAAAAAAGLHAHQHHLQQQHSQPHLCGVQQQQHGSGGGAAPPQRRGLRMRLLRRRDEAAGNEAPHGVDSLQLAMEQAHLLLFKDGTLISLFSNNSAGVVPRVLQQLEGYRSPLTDSEDASYLLHAILDGIVDNLVPVVNMYATHTERLEAQVLQAQRPRLELTQDLHKISSHVKALRRALVPTQALIHKLQCSKSRGGFLSKLTTTYMRDVYDHINTVVEDMDTLNEDAKGLIDLIFDKVNHNVNASLRMLAVMSTLFLPITFIAGIYGTNFNGEFPEIHWRYGYYYFLALCGAVTLIFLLFLRQMGMWGGH